MGCVGAGKENGPHRQLYLTLYKYFCVITYLLTYLLTCLLTQCRVLLRNSNLSVLSANSLMTTHVAVTAFKWDPKPSKMRKLRPRPRGGNAPRNVAGITTEMSHSSSPETGK